MQTKDDRGTGMRHIATGLSVRSSMATSGSDQSATALQVSNPQSGINLPSQIEDKDRDDAIRTAIRGPLTAMTAMHMMPAREGQEAVAFWVEALRPYRVEQIRDAFTHFARTGGGKYPSPQIIIETINKLKGRSCNTRQIKA